jgi:mannose PTS system EIID component
MFFRSFAVQGSWNYETLIGAGFAFVLLPALRQIHGKEGRALDDAVVRHCELFNSHPYLSTVAAGAVIRLEADGVQPAVIQRFKAALRGSLGSLGDRLIWSTWRPMAVLAGIVLLLAGAAWWVAVVTSLLVYNLLHLILRGVGLQMGIEAGMDVGRRLKEAPLHLLIDRSSQAACFLIGAGALLAFAPAARDLGATVVALAAVALGLWFGQRSRKLFIALLAGAAALGLVMGLIGNGA